MTLPTGNATIDDLTPNVRPAYIKYTALVTSIICFIFFIAYLVFQVQCMCVWLSFTIFIKCLSPQVVVVVVVVVSSSSQACRDYNPHLAVNETLLSSD